MSGHSPLCRASSRRVWALGLGLAGCLLLSCPLSLQAADVPPAQIYLQQAATAVHQIQLGGDQSALRRDIASLLLKLDRSAAQDAIAGIGRPSDAARTLAALAVALAPKDAAGAKQAAAMGGRFLQRISEPDRRLEEYRLFLREIAPLGADAPAAVPEVPAEEAHLLVIEALAAQDPEKALALITIGSAKAPGTTAGSGKRPRATTGPAQGPGAAAGTTRGSDATPWSVTGPGADSALAALAPRLAAAKPDQALALASQIASPELHDQTLWLIAEARPVAEAGSIAALMQDPVARGGALAGAAQRLAGTDVEAALRAADEVTVSPLSARAEVVAEVASREEAKGADLARQLPEPARTWAMAQLAAGVAAIAPDRAEGYLKDAGGGADLTSLVAAKMAPVDPERALRLVRTLPSEDRAASLADLIVALAPTRVAQAKELMWEVENPPDRDRAVAAVARQLARDGSVDAATSVLGLISDLSQAPVLRAELAVAVAPRDPAGAQRLLESVPQGEARSLNALQAGRMLLTSGGKLDASIALAAEGMPRDLAGRWLLPEAARQGVGALGDVAEKLEEPYWRSLGLVEAARVLLKAESAPQPAPERARMIRPVVEWEGS